MWAGDTDADAMAFARRHWKDAERLDDAKLLEVLEAAQPTVVEYAPVLALGAPVPMHYRLAHVYHAREVAAAAARGDGDVVGVAEYGAIRARPLTSAVKQLLRPQRSRPGIG
jgi:hypothetical protein